LKIGEVVVANFLTSFLNLLFMIIGGGQMEVKINFHLNQFEINKYFTFLTNGTMLFFLF